LKSEQEIREYMKRHDKHHTSDWEQALGRESVEEALKWILDEGPEGDEDA
jgi:hypothetical protein